MGFNIGIKTIGNATLIAFDKNPILSTDPWMSNNGAYFGSWIHSHIIPDNEIQNILNSEYIWFSHGHPDHLNPESIKYFKNNKILLSDHIGSRIKEQLIQEAYDVTILPDRKWINLSKNIKIFSVADFAQNSILLVDVNDRLFVNLNDAPPRYWEKTVKNIIKQYKNSYLLKLFGWGDADMINYFDEDNNHLPTLLEKKCNYALGPALYKKAEYWGTNHVIPFSSLHQYQRIDSSWANKFVPPIEKYGENFPDNNYVTYIDPYVQINCENGDIIKINPVKVESKLIDPIDFGDNWSDSLQKCDIVKIKKYFQHKELLNDFLGFINFRVGKQDNFIDINNKLKTGITFEVPHNSLMQAIDFEIFDDLLIGNFMKTTMHSLEDLYNPNFNLYVTKIADNGRAQSKKEVKKYLNNYKRRCLLDYLFYQIEKTSMKYMRPFIPSDGSFGKIRDKLKGFRRRYF